MLEQTNKKNLLPWLETIPVGSGQSGSPALTSGYRYIHYSSPLTELVWLTGFTANFQDADIRIQLSESRQPDTWIPFYSTQMTAICGDFDQVEPVLQLPTPYPIAPGSRVQIRIQNTDASNFSNTYLTLVGVRERVAA